MTTPQERLTPKLSSSCPFVVSLAPRARIGERTVDACRRKRSGISNLASSGPDNCYRLKIPFSLKCFCREVFQGKANHILLLDQSHTVVGLRPRQNRSLKRETATRVFAIGTAPTFAPRQGAGNGSDPCQAKQSLALHWLCRRCCWQTSDMQSKFRQFTKDHGPYATVVTTNRPRMS